MQKAGHGVVQTPRSPMQEGELLHSFAAPMGIIPFYACFYKCGLMAF